jgi:hypothetical protein
VGTHRRISAARSNPCAANAGGPTGRARREGWVGLDSKIDRPTDPSPRAVKGARRQFPLRSSGFQGVAARVGGFYSVAAPISLRAGRNGQRASRGLYIGDSHGVAEPRHALPPLTAPPRQLAPCTAEGATLGQRGIPMIEIAPAVGTAPARRLRRPAADRGGSVLADSNDVTERTRFRSVTFGRSPGHDDSRGLDSGGRPVHQPGECAAQAGRIAPAAQNPTGCPGLHGSQPLQREPFHGLHRHEHSAPPAATSSRTTYPTCVALSASRSDPQPSTKSTRR